MRPLTRGELLVILVLGIWLCATIATIFSKDSDCIGAAVFITFLIGFAYIFIMCADERLGSELVAARARIAQLSEALEPFARVGTVFSKSDNPECGLFWHHGSTKHPESFGVAIKHVIAASKVMEEPKP